MNKIVKLISILFLVSLTLGVFSACSKSDDDSKYEKVDMRMFDEPSTPNIEKVTFATKELTPANNSVPTFGEVEKPSSTQILADNSQLITTFDSYGNKIETRTFYNHPNLTLLVLKTSLDGRREAVVYGQNGERSKLSAEKLERALSASGNELAQSTGIFETKRSKPTPTIPQKPSVMQTIPSVNQIPSQIPQVSNEPKVESPPN